MEVKYSSAKLLPRMAEKSQATNLDTQNAPKCDIAMSVVIPTSGRVDLLQETLTCLALQTSRDFEVIITDDSPNENDRQAIRESVSRFADDTDLRTKYIFSQPRLYQAANTNQGLQKAQGNLIRILHSDDLLRSDAVESEIALFADHPQLELLFEDIIPFTDQVDWEGTADKTFVSAAHHLRTHLSHCTAVPSGMVFTSAALRDAGLMDERLKFLCDWDLFCRLLVTQIEKRNLVANLSPGLVGWRTHADSVTGRLWQTHFHEHELFIKEFWQSERVRKLNLFTPYEQKAFQNAASRYRYKRVRHDFRHLPLSDKLRSAPWYARYGISPLRKLSSLQRNILRAGRKAIGKLPKKHKTTTETDQQLQPQPSNPSASSVDQDTLAIAPFYNHEIINQHKINWVVDFDNTLNLWSERNQLAASPRVRIFYPNINRMYQRTLHEFLKYIAVGNEVEIVMTGNNHLEWFGLKAAISQLFPGQFTLEKQDKNKHDEWRLLYRRTKEVQPHLSAPHTGWTFGLLTLGDKPERAITYFESIRQACHQPYEVFVVCPAHLDFLDKYPEVQQIVFSKRDDLGWITKKKNLICEAANFSEILICHDRFTLAPDFCEAFDSWGYSYGIAAPRLLLKDGQRAVDWAVVSSQNHVWSSGGLLDYRSYSPYAYVPGGATLLRKDFWNQFPWDENLYWNEHEDVELCRRAQKHGEIIHLANATLIAEADRWIEQNKSIPFCPDREHLFGKPVGEQRIKFLKKNA